MPYVITREEKDLKLKVGQQLKFEKGKLPAALKFSAKWQEPEQEEAEPEKEESKPAEKPKGKSSK